jgi:dihydroneopterin aldolase
MSTPMPGTSLTEITLRGLRFFAFVGILPHERDRAQPIEVDITVTLTAAKGVVDYAKVYDAVSGVLEDGAIDFMEQVAERVIESTFAISERIHRVRVAVRKPHVALGGPLEYAEVVVTHDVGT